MIIDCDQIPQAPIKRSKRKVIKANLKPTVKYPIATNIAIVYHQGIWVKNVSSGLSNFKYTNPLNPFVNAIKLSLTVNDSTPFAIGCLKDSFHYLGNVPNSKNVLSIKDIKNKIIKDGIK